MRIAFLAHQAQLQDGQGRVNYEILKAALDAGHHVTVVAEHCSDVIANHANGRFVHISVDSVPTRLLKNLYFAEKSAVWLRKHRSEYDLVQVNVFVTWEPADIVAVHFVHRAWLRNPYFPFRWSSFSPYAYYQLVVAHLSAYFEQKTFESGKLLVAVSRATAAEVSGLGISPAKIRVVANGVDTAEFFPGASEREMFNLPGEVFMALFAGDIRTPRKNLDTVLKAMAAIPELHLAVAGDTADSPYPEMAQHLGIASRVHFIGKTSRIPLLMRSVDCFVIPSRYESYGLVVLEAMASGLPVIVSSQVGSADFVGDVCKVIADPDDTAALVAALTDLIRFPERAREMGAAARERGPCRCSGLIQLPDI